MSVCHICPSHLLSRLSIMSIRHVCLSRPSVMSVCHIRLLRLSITSIRHVHLSITIVCPSRPSVTHIRPSRLSVTIVRLSRPSVTHIRPSRLSITSVRHVLCHVRLVPCNLIRISYLIREIMWNRIQLVFGFSVTKTIKGLVSNVNYSVIIKYQNVSSKEYQWKGNRIMG